MCIVLVGCATAPTEKPPEFTPTIAATDTPLPTDTATPTNTPEPTATDVPTATITPTVEPPAPLLDLLDGIEVVRLDNFNNMGNWDLYNAKVMDGSVGFDETLSPGGSLSYRFEFGEGEGVMFNIQYPGTRTSGIFGYCFENGSYQTDGDKQFCVSDLQYPYIFRGKEYIGLNAFRGHGAVKIKKNTWITILHVVGAGGTFFSALWVADDPSKIATKYYDGHHANWSNNAWRFDIYREDRDKTPFIIDDFMLLKFKDIKIKK